ncbi:MAG TPA: RsmB/NOP family class I SAM-dependent RNA methyltransferase, partial [Solirubrobacteraceae bacterium]
LCAAPGAKTTHLAALMGDQGELVAVERHPGRADALRRTLQRMHVTRAAVRTADATDIAPDAAVAGGAGAAGAAGAAGEDRYDRVLVDPPCSGLGTLQSRPDVRWRTSPDRIAQLAPQQSRILAAGAGATAPGGVLVYSVCTISAAESEAVVDGFVAEHPRWEVDAIRRTAPDVDGTDGFFIATLRHHG